MDDWKEKIINEKLGGKRDWTDEERTELAHHLDIEFDKRLASIDSSGKPATRPEDAWTEDNWKEKMSEHPLFAPYLAEQEGKTDIELKPSALSEGLAQLKFDPEHNTPVELAQNYKEDGVYNFKYKNYRIAIKAFTEGLKQKCKDQELNAQLYNNRAAAHAHLENYRSAIKDCDDAVKIKPDYLKAIVRAAQCATKIASWDEVISWCDKGLQHNSTDETFLKMRTTAMKEKKINERNLRKRLQGEKQKTAKEQNLLTRILSSGVCLGDKETKGSQSLDLSDLEPCHPAAQGSRVLLNDDDELIWPVLFLYPEFHETDFIREFNENSCLCDHMEAMFGSDIPPAPWDTDHSYKSSDLCIFFEDVKKNKLCKVDPKMSLKQVLQDSRYVVKGGTPGFIILVKDSKFFKEFIEKYK